MAYQAGIGRFQFLIGILKTPMIYEAIAKYMEFQFLIGILKTDKGDPGPAGPAGPFQFLIGILKTDRKGMPLLKELRVSIPYRYSKNKSRTCHTPLCIPVSIPYRYSKNSRFLVSPMAAPLVSIPYRYSKNQEEREQQRS